MRGKSVKRLRFELELSRMRDVIEERSQGACEARLSGCTGRAMHIHHMAGRTRKEANRPDLLLHTCFECHESIHRFPARSYAMGLLVHRNGVL